MSNEEPRRPPEERTALAVEADDVLLRLTRLANQTTIRQLSMTLWVRGEELHGDLIPARVWHERVAASLDKNAPGGSDLAEAFRTWGRGKFPSESEAEALDIDRSRDPTVIVHFETTDKRLVRIRLASVDAWAIGYPKRED